MAADGSLMSSQLHDQDTLYGALHLNLRRAKSLIVARKSVHHSKAYCKATPPFIVIA